MDLVTGATGYVGGRLVERLLEDGREVRALAREPSGLTASGVEAVAGDVTSGEGVRAALDGCENAYYLVHSMEPAQGDVAHDFAARDRQAARRFADAATAAGVRRVVYLGGLAPRDSAPSPHIASRLEVEEIVLERAPGATALRASILIGARSASFRILVRLIERLRVLPLPAWRERVTQPVAERDAIDCLVRAPGVDAASGRSLDIAGRDVVSYGRMVERIAEHMGVGRMPLGLGFSLTPPASAVVSAIVGQPLELVRPLMESLEHDLLPRPDADAAAMFGLRPLGFDRAVERALADWESHEELAAW